MDERETRRSQGGVALVSIYEKGKERRERGKGTEEERRKKKGRMERKKEEKEK